MTELLRKIFVKNYNDVTNPKVRDGHARLACFVGIISNLLLFAFKFAFGFISGSVSIVGDSINNLSDMGSSIITLLGFKFASMPADKEHPYGHERLEYITGLIVSIIILIVGVELLKNSITSIVNNTQIVVTIPTLIILSVSILIKLWQGFFYKKIGKKIDSVALEANASDSLNDVLSTTVILIGSLVIYFIPTLPFCLDGVLGILVSIFIFISAIGLIKETTNPLIGMNPKHSYITEVINDIKKNPIILGVHDIRCHMYGPTKSFMTLHCEVDSNQDILTAHDEIDNIERYIKNKYGIELTIHMDPIETNNPYVNSLKERVTNVLTKLNLTFHDFRVVKGETHTNIIFDIIVPRDYQKSNEEIKEILEEEFKNDKEKYYFAIEFDGDYID